MIAEPDDFPWEDINEDVARGIVSIARGMAARMDMGTGVVVYRVGPTLIRVDINLREIYADG